MGEPAPALSIIIPAYNEEDRLPATLERIRAFLVSRGMSAEIIVVDDGSTDGTARVAGDWMARLPGLRLVSNGRNRGKGYSVRHGMLKARGEIALFTDADLSTPIEEADKLFAALERADIAFGSRALDRNLIEVHQPWLRERAGIIFNLIVRLTVGLPFVDTQCGFKAFRREQTKIIFDQQRIERFGFDPEILFLAQRHGLRAVEVPARWAHDRRTRVRVVRDSFRMLGELLAIRRNALLGRYPRRSAVS